MLLPSAAVELIWQDETGSTAMTTWFAASSLTVEEIDAFAITLASILASLTDAVLVKQRIIYKWAPEVRGTASAATSIKRTGIFFFSTGDDMPEALISVPSVKDAILETTGPREGVGVILSNSDVIAFETAVIDNGITNPFGDTVIVLDDAYLQSRV